MTYQDPKGTEHDSWWDSGPVYIVFAIVALFILSMGLFDWPHNDITGVNVHVSGWWKILGIVLWLSFVGIFIGMAIDRITVSIGTIILSGACLALSLCSFCGFWYGVH